VRVSASVPVERPAAEVYAALAAPERRPEGAGWSAVSRSNGGYTARLHASAGPITLDFDCRFELVEESPGQAVRLRGAGRSPRLGFTFDARFDVRAANGASTVDVEADVGVTGPLAGLGQRTLHERARRLIAAYVAA
jgi:carbon monoxide dehydrogenase subunit G